jgi:hypothetical protein
MEPGIYDDISDAEYRRIPAISRSDLLEWAGLSKAIDKTAATMGIVFHMAMLEPHLIAESVMVGPEVDRRYTEGKQAWAEAEAKADERGMMLVTPKALDTLRSMVAGVLHDPQLSKLHKAARAGQTRNEVTVIWERDGVLLKARIDQVTKKALIDWKSTGLLEPDDFAASCVGYNYHVQSAMYQDGWASATGEHLPFIHAACSKRQPHPCWLHRIPQSDIDHGKTLYETLVRLYAQKGSK